MREDFGDVTGVIFHGVASNVVESNTEGVAGRVADSVVDRI